MEGLVGYEAGVESRCEDVESFCGDGSFDWRNFVSRVEYPLPDLSIYRMILDLEWRFNACDLMHEIFPEDVGDEAFVFGPVSIQNSVLNKVLDGMLGVYISSAVAVRAIVPCFTSGR